MPSPSAVPTSVPSAVSRHAAASSAKKTGLNDVFKRICAEAMEGGMGEKEALEHAVRRLQEEMKK